ncbi:hypothetical protein TOPH_03711 [Tolypocladium ophioglossoides CBS 100239]|uniref:Uncharacterized protein n=1 Tax=Tolypocladium ophioglossoides (strain CBS 100239) TaxID=1163406 RepID=A0A0L0NBK1_TOLOC|nr:hypothetical protein TOPH_03711 [Tolypocladium ophioglossoides CBS 100239]
MTTHVSIAWLAYPYLPEALGVPMHALQVEEPVDAVGEAALFGPVELGVLDVASDALLPADLRQVLCLVLVVELLEVEVLDAGLCSVHVGRGGRWLCWRRMVFFPSPDETRL